MQGALRYLNTIVREERCVDDRFDAVLSDLIGSGFPSPMLLLVDNNTREKVWQLLIVMANDSCGRNGMLCGFERCL